MIKDDRYFSSLHRFQIYHPGKNRNWCSRMNKQIKPAHMLFLDLSLKHYHTGKYFFFIAVSWADTWQACCRWALCSVLGSWGFPLQLCAGTSCEQELEQEITYLHCQYLHPSVLVVTIRSAVRGFMMSLWAGTNNRELTLDHAHSFYKVDNLVFYSTWKPIWLLHRAPNE